jgi:hypothetical protein
MATEDCITIIEGPPPVFEPVQDGWALGLNEGPLQTVTALTRLRTFNGPALVERCYGRWHNQQSIELHYRNEMGLVQTAPISAARTVQTPDGHVLLLWIYLNRDEVEFEVDSADDQDTDDGLDRPEE